jgi:hypothetical protein
MPNYMDWPRPFANIGTYPFGLLLLSNFVYNEATIEAVEIYCERPGQVFLAVIISLNLIIYDY